jgi:DNA modification methylase
MLGDNISSLKKLPDNSIDSIVSDPPYGLSFMGKKWDYDVPSVEFWSEVYRVLKPGGHVLSFGGTRTYHRMVVNIEDAGFEIRDQIMWLYGSGFPKSLNISKAIDKVEGNERKVIGKKIQRVDGTLRNVGATGAPFLIDGVEGSISKPTDGYIDVEEPGSENSKKYNGWGTALKPANEPICVARKPLSEKSVAENVLKWGTGGINIDGCRVGTDDKLQKLVHQEGCNRVLYDPEQRENGKKIEFVDAGEGRFPANIILECLCDEVIKGEKGEPYMYVDKEYNNKELQGDRQIDFLKGSKAEAPNNYNDKGDIHTNPMCPCYLMDEQSGISKPKKERTGRKGGTNESDFSKAISADPDFIGRWPGDNGGGASRFFYQAKVSKQERNMGLDNFEETTTGGKGHGLDRRCSNCNTSMLKPEDCKCENPNWITPPKKNSHPTVKPVSLMAYLCRLVTPPNGIVLDPFMGSGSTGIAAQLEGFRFCGMEMDKDYFKIAEARIENFESYRKFLKK